jgi:hypothetical protein
MSDALDLTTNLLHVVGGQSTSDEPPGFAVLAAPRRAARGRTQDNLLLCLGLRSRGSIPPERFAELLDLAAVTFFGSPGSVTAALRQALTAANQKLLELNLREGANGVPVQGGLIGAVVRGADFYAVQSGPGTLIVARPEGVERFPNAPSRPLGLSNTLETQYFHTVVKADDYLCLSSSAPAGWNEVALIGLGHLSTLTAVSERLQNAANADFAALVGRFEPASRAASISLTRFVPPVERSGKTAASRPSPAVRWPEGLTSLFKPRPAPAVAESSTSDPNDAPQPVSAAVESEPADATPASPHAASAPSTDWQDLLRRAERLGGGRSSSPDLEAPDPKAFLVEEPAPRLNPLASLGEPLQRGLRSVGRAFGVTLTEATRGLRRLMARTLPEGMLQKEGLFEVPRSVLIGIALGFPLLVGVIVGGLYIQQGRAQLFDDALAAAQLEVAIARQQPDTLAARPHWERALSLLNQAEQIRAGQAEVVTLHQEAQSKLDELDWITRLDYQPLVAGGLGRGTQIKRLLLVGQDVYALDGTRNRVFRITPSPTLGYIVDQDFDCAGGRAVADKAIGELIDIGLIFSPDVMKGDAIVALDSTGALLYCAPGLTPFAGYLPAPDVSWIRPTALEVYADRLYVLDVGSNQIWQLQGSGGAFNQPPTSYFTSAVYDLSGVIDFSIASGDVFMLQRDGRVLTCSRLTGAEGATCAQAAQFSDQRPGQASGDRLADVTAPLSLTYDPPPEPSLYLLDKETGGVYQLSLKLALVRQFRPVQTPSAPTGIAAVAIDPAKRVFVGAGENVYVAPRP